MVSHHLLKPRAWQPDQFLYIQLRPTVLLLDNFRNFIRISKNTGGVYHGQAALPMQVRYLDDDHGYQGALYNVLAERLNFVVFQIFIQVRLTMSIVWCLSGVLET